MRRLAAKRSIFHFIKKGNIETFPCFTIFFEDIQKAYRSCGWKVKFFKMTGVSDKEGEGNFYSDNNLKMKEWGGTIDSTGYHAKKHGSSKSQFFNSPVVPITVSIIDFVFRFKTDPQNNLAPVTRSGIVPFLPFI